MRTRICAVLYSGAYILVTMLHCQYINTLTVYTFLFTLEQLDRCQDMQDRSLLRIIHILLDDQNHYEDRYVTLIDCTPEQATILYML